MLSRKQQYEEEKKRLIEEKFSPQRGDNFRNFIRSILTAKCRLPNDKVNEYLNHLDLFEQAFTHSSFNPERNYESLEILGDSCLNYCVVYYLTRRFPHLMNSNGSGVGTIARLKINLVSKLIFSQCAQELGFKDHIASDMLTRRDEMPSLLEDTFEAFQGCLIQVINLCDPQSSKKGYIPTLGPSYRIVCAFFDNMEISLRYVDLYDAKTRLKEALDIAHLGHANITFSQIIDHNGKIVFTYKIKIPNLKDSKEWGTGTGFRKVEAEQNACKNAIANLEKAKHIQEKVS